MIAAKAILPSALAQRPAGELREPVVQRGEAAQHRAAHEHGDRVALGGRGVVELPADREHGVGELAGEADRHRADRPEREQRRRPGVERAAPQGRDPVEDQQADRDRQREREEHREDLEAERDRGGVHVLHPGERSEHGDRKQREHRAAMAEQRLSRERRQDVRDHPAGDDQDEHVGAGEEEPGEVLVQERRAALAGVEEDAAVVAVDEEHGQRGEHHRADHQEQVAAQARGPGEQRHAAPGHAGRAHVVQRDDEVDREADEAQDREPRADDPGVDPRRVREDVVGERGERRQAGLGRPVEEAAVDGHGPRQIQPERQQVETREGDPARADLERRDVADQPQGQRDREQDHRGDSEHGHDPVEDLGVDRRVLGNDQLHPHEHELDHRQGQEAERGAHVQHPDRLVVRCSVARSTQPGRRRGISSVTTSGRGGATVVGGVTG